MLGVLQQRLDAPVGVGAFAMLALAALGVFLHSRASTPASGLAAATLLSAALRLLLPPLR